MLTRDFDPGSILDRVEGEPYTVQLRGLEPIFLVAKEEVGLEPHHSSVRNTARNSSVFMYSQGKGSVEYFGQPISALIFCRSPWMFVNSIRTSGSISSTVGSE